MAACKLTGTGTYNDVLSMAVAGADPVYDFVDAGLPTTVVPEDTFRAAVELLEEQVVFTGPCASDPYAVVGIEEAFGTAPDLVTGIATNTTAGVDLVEQLSDCSALNLVDEDATEPLAEMLAEALDG